jgi:trans-aconitate 2-methyltransferase
MGNSMTEWNADDYFRHSSLQAAMAEQVLALLELKGIEKILDVGCGDGKITARIAARVPGGSVLGVDPSRDMVRFASAHFGPPEFTNLRFEVGEAVRLPGEDEFDLVVSFNALHWVSAHGEALRAIHRSLRPDGRAMVRFVPAGERKSLETVIDETCRSPKWSSHFGDLAQPFTHLAPEEYRTLAVKSQFRVDRLNVRDEAWDFGSRDAFAAFCRATLAAWTSRLPINGRATFIDEVLDRYRLVAADGPAEANTFKFYQMDVELSALKTPGAVTAGTS